MKNILILFIAATFLNMSSCNEKTSKTEKTNAVQSTTPQKKKINNINIISPDPSEEMTIGDEVKLSLQLIDENKAFDSVLVYFDNHIIARLEKDNLNFNWIPDIKKVGKHKIKVSSYYEGFQTEYDYRDLIFKSDIEPELYTAKIIAEYKHDKNAYTQGLLIEDGVMYEGTGRKKKSWLRKVNYKTGEVIENLNLPDKYFGEGIAVFNDKIYQLTWISRTGFIYDLKSFTLLRTFQYPTQGWGLTTDGEKLFMSDGSEKIFTVDHEYFSELSRIEVYDNNGKIDSLNELEYIDNLLYANVYQEDYFIIIDPQTGKVLKKVDCKHLGPQEFASEFDKSNDVLNGIAYNRDTKQLFVTGKHWPQLYEIELVKK